MSTSLLYHAWTGHVVAGSDYVLPGVIIAHLVHEAVGALKLAVVEAAPAVEGFIAVGFPIQAGHDLFSKLTGISRSGFDR